MRAAWCAAALSLVAGSCHSLYAGSVFMKNGYIIHGPVKEVVEDPATNQLVAVVIGWEHGKVTLLSRFIENVVFEAGELESLKARARESAAAEEGEDAVVEREILLPPLPVDAMAIFRDERRPALVPAPDAPAERLGGGASAVALGERRKIFRGLYASLPQGWTLSALPDAWVIEGPRGDAAGVAARMAGTVFARELGRRAQTTAAVDQIKKAFSEWTLLEEGPRELGLQEAYEIVSRGAHGGATYRIRQILAWVGKATCMVNCVWMEESGAAPQIESCLQSFEFVASEMSE
ncbi:MAG TPA: hypothetical protein DCM87_21650 [Planctomycetes bacterium]|nr:hypothetical protein [Planctomycetota bacterium]